jgi:hypothetical protein
MRKPTRALLVGARLHRREPTLNTARPIWKTRRRPKRSAIDPESIKKLATTTVYPSTAHARPATLAWRSRRIAGSATFTIVRSIVTRKSDRQQIARMTARDLTTPPAGPGSASPPPS